MKLFSVTASMLLFAANALATPVTVKVRVEVTSYYDYPSASYVTTSPVSGVVSFVFDIDRRSIVDYGATTITTFGGDLGTIWLSPLTPIIPLSPYSGAYGQFYNSYTFPNTSDYTDSFNEDAAAQANTYYNINNSYAAYHIEVRASRQSSRRAGNGTSDYSFTRSSLLDYYRSFAASAEDVYFNESFSTYSFQNQAPVYSSGKSWETYKGKILDVVDHVNRPNRHLYSANDFNLDDRADLLWRNTRTGALYLWLMDGSRYSRDGAVSTFPVTWKIAGTGDFDNDGWTDIVWQNPTTGDRYISFMRGSTYLRNVAIGNVAAAWEIATAADLNGDGSIDILWQNTETGDRYVWFMNGTAPIGGTALGKLPLEWSIVAAGDFNGDSKPDLLWENKVTGERYVWFMNGANATGGNSLGIVPTDWSIANVGDYNSDGKPDIVWQNTVTGARYIWFMNGTTYLGDANLGFMPVEWSISR